MPVLAMLLLHLCNRVIFLFDLDHRYRSSTIWSFIGKFSSQRNHLWVQYMGLGQQLRHRQAPLISCHPFLPVLVMRLQARKLPLASAWVFSFAHRILKYWLIVIKQTAHNLGVSTSVPALEISDLPPVSVSSNSFATSYNHLITAID